MPLFDTLFAAADSVLDGMFAGLAWCRAQGVEIAIRASVRAHEVGTDNDKTAAETWIGFAVECYCQQLIVSGQRFKPNGGEEFVFGMSDGTKKVYTAIVGPKGRCYEPLDTIDRKMLVFCKFDRDE